MSSIFRPSPWAERSLQVAGQEPVVFSGRFSAQLCSSSCSSKLRTERIVHSANQWDNGILMDARYFPIRDPLHSARLGRNPSRMNER